MAGTEKTVRLMRCIKHLCYVSNITADFLSFRCPNCDTFSKTAFNVEQHLTTCNERVKIVYPRNVYQTREARFDKLDSFGIKNTSQQKPQ